MIEFIHETILSLNDNIIFTGLVSLLINILSKYISFHFTPFTEKLISSSVTQEILFFLMSFSATKNIYIAFCLTFLFIAITQFLFNEESIFCIIDKSLIQEFKNQDDDIKPTQSEIEKAKKILKNAAMYSLFYS